MFWALFVSNLPKSHNFAGICLKTLQLGDCGKPEDPSSVLTSRVNHLGHVTSKGLISVEIFRVKCGI